MPHEVKNIVYANTLTKMIALRPPLDNDLVQKFKKADQNMLQHKLSFELLQCLCDKNYDWAQKTMAQYIEFNHSSRTEIAQVIQLYEKAAKNGNRGAYHRLIQLNSIGLFK